MLWHADWRLLFKLTCIHRWRDGLNFRRGTCPFRGACFQAYYSKLIAKESTATELCAGRLMGNFILFSDSYVPVQSGTAFYRAIQMDAGKGTFFSLGGDVNCLFYKPVAWSNLGIFVRTVTGTWNVWVMVCARCWRCWRYWRYWYWHMFPVNHIWLYCIWLIITFHCRRKAM